MKLSITSTEKLEKFYLKDLNDKVFNIELDKEQNIPEGWYELIIPYISKKVEIFDILINDESIKEIIFTGFYTDAKNKKHQPANAIWDENGYYSIWLHTQLGFLYQRFYDQIKPGDFGSNLFTKYMLTIDRNIKINDNWSNSLKSYFAYGNGPNWWLKNSKYTPYEIIDDNYIRSINTDHLLNELEKFLVNEIHDMNGHKGWDRLGYRKTYTKLAYNENLLQIEDISNTLVKDFVKKLGYKNIIDIEILKLKKDSFIPIHKDAYTDKIYQNNNYTFGAKKFYWNISNSKNIYFKLGTSGLLPLESPLFINTANHVHAVVNQSNDGRVVISVKGEL